MSKIAIVEDDDAVRMLYRLKLEKEGFEVAVAKDGVEGLALIETFLPDLVLLDLMLPQMSGDKVLEAMRQQPWGKTIKVIIMTNLTEEEAPDNIGRLQVSQYIIKALYTPSQLIEIVERVLAT